MPAFDMLPVENDNEKVTTHLNVTKRSKSLNRQLVSTSTVAFEKYAVTRAPSAIGPRQAATTFAIAPLTIRKKEVRFDLDQSGCSASSSGSSFLHPSMPPGYELTTPLNPSIKCKSVNPSLGKTTPAYRYHAYKETARAKNLRVLVLPVFLDFDIQSDADEYSSGDMEEAWDGSTPSHLHKDKDDLPSCQEYLSDDASDAYSETPEGRKIPENGPDLSLEALEKIMEWAYTLKPEDLDEMLESDNEDVVSSGSSSYGEYDDDDDADEELFRVNEDDDGDNAYESNYEDEDEDDAMYYLSDEHAYQESLFNELSEGLV